MRTEPPFDNHPCPMCPGVFRGFSAVVHNFLSQWDRALPHEDRTQRKLAYVMDAVPEVFAALTRDTHPAIRALHAAAERLVARVEVEGVSRMLQPVITELHAAYVPVRVLGEAHFADRRHSHGEPNLG